MIVKVITKTFFYPGKHYLSYLRVIKETIANTYHDSNNENLPFACIYYGIKDEIKNTTLANIAVAIKKITKSYPRKQVRDNKDTLALTYHGIKSDNKNLRWRIFTRPIKVVS